MKHSILMLIICCSIFSSYTAFSQDDAEDVIKYRQNMMKIISMHYKSLKLLSAGRITQPDQWSPQARGLNNMAKMIITAYLAARLIPIHIDCFQNLQVSILHL